MKINNISTRGFFIYSDLSYYEEGDFVVYGNTIYVCSPKSGTSLVIGEKPYESENFYVYLGDQLADEKEFIEFSKNGGGKDKYISLSSLVGILNTYMKGINTSGVIGHEFVLDGDNVVYKIDNNISKVYDEEDSSHILSTILLDESINHGIFKVSKNLPELRTFIGNLGDYCILRQYSYYSEEKESLIRVQELIDIESSVSLNPQISYANIYYRSAALDSPLNEVIDLGFLSATAHTEYLSRKAESLFKMYATKMKLFQTRIKELENCFCFCNLITGNLTSSVSFQNKDKKQKNYLNINSIEELGPLTINVILENGDTYKNYSLTVDLSSIDSFTNEKNFFISDRFYISIKINENNSSSGVDTMNTVITPITDTIEDDTETEGSDNITSTSTNQPPQNPDETNKDLPLLTLDLINEGGDSKSYITSIYYRKFFNS